MKSKFILLVATLAFYSCSSTQSTSTNDGSSKEKAIKVRSVDKEYEIMRTLCPDCKMKSQGLTSNENRTKYYDVLTFIKPTGEEVRYYFDITSFYGKF